MEPPTTDRSPAGQLLKEPVYCGGGASWGQLRDQDQSREDRNRRSDRDQDGFDLDRRSRKCTCGYKRKFRWIRFFVELKFHLDEGPHGASLPQTEAQLRPASHGAGLPRACVQLGPVPHRAGLPRTEAQLGPAPDGARLPQARVQLGPVPHGAGVPWTVLLGLVPEGTDLLRTSTLDTVPLGAGIQEFGFSWGRFPWEPVYRELGLRQCWFLLREGSCLGQEAQSSWGWFWEPVYHRQSGGLFLREPDYHWQASDFWVLRLVLMPSRWGRFVQVTLRGHVLKEIQHPTVDVAPAFLQRAMKSGTRITGQLRQPTTSLHTWPNTWDIKGCLCLFKHHSQAYPWLIKLCVLYYNFNKKQSNNWMHKKNAIWIEMSSVFLC